ACRTTLSRGVADSELEAPLGIGLRPADGWVFLTVEGIDRMSTGERQAGGPDRKYRGISHGMPEMVEDAATDSSTLLQANHRVDPVLPGGRSLDEDRLGDVAVCEDARRPAFLPPDRRAEMT